MPRGNASVGGPGEREAAQPGVWLDVEELMSRVHDLRFISGQPG